MSWEVGGIVSRKQCGGAVRRVIMLAMASIAGNDGRDIYTSIPQLARDSEVDPRTVQRTLKDLLNEGLVELVGQRKCPRGYTNEYRLVMSAVHAMPNIIRREDIEEDHPRQSATRGSLPPRRSVTGDTQTPLTERRPSQAKAPETLGDIASDPRHTVTPDKSPPPAERHPTLFPSNTNSPSVTSIVVLESENSADDPKPLPKNWQPRAALKRKAIEELNFTEQEFDDVLIEFIDYWASRRSQKAGKKSERGWNAALGTRINELAARWRTQYRKNAPRGASAGSGNQHSGDNILAAVARRRSENQEADDLPFGSYDGGVERVA